EVYGAMIFLTVIPVIIVFIIFQRWFVAGLTSGAIKG
ncbi:MAG: carbohydrate ABC transporter permease, partial [Actinobacteria bacterium]|nr:carbohydrate ABC transporter permease [Actinomycetota bacterium]